MEYYYRRIPEDLLPKEHDYPEENVPTLVVYSRSYIAELGEGRMALEDQDLDNQDDDVAVRCCGFCNPNKGDFFNWPPP